MDVMLPITSADKQLSNSESAKFSCSRLSDEISCRYVDMGIRRKSQHSCVIHGGDVLPLQQEKREYQGENQARQDAQLEHHVSERRFDDFGGF